MSVLTLRAAFCGVLPEGRACLTGELCALVLSSISELAAASSCCSGAVSTPCFLRLEVDRVWCALLVLR